MDALDLFAADRYWVTGRSGVGKSTLIKHLLSKSMRASLASAWELYRWAASTASPLDFHQWALLRWQIWSPSDKTLSSLHHSKSQQKGAGPDAHISEWLHKLIILWLVLLILRLLRSRTFEFPNNLRHPCTTMPWTIWPALVVLWGVCWMFYGSGSFQPELDNGHDASYPWMDHFFAGFFDGTDPPPEPHVSWPYNPPDGSQHAWYIGSGAEYHHQTAPLRRPDARGPGLPSPLATTATSTTVMQGSEDLDWPGARDWQSVSPLGPLGTEYSVASGQEVPAVPASSSPRPLNPDLDGQSDASQLYTSYPDQDLVNNSRGPISHEVLPAYANPTGARHPSCPPSAAASGAPGTVETTTNQAQRTTAGRSLSCPHPGCESAVFKSAPELRRHKARHDRRFECDRCGRVCGAQKDLDRHRSEVHQIGCVPFPCPVEGCARRANPFGRKENLKRHLNDVHSKKGSSPASPDGSEQTSASRKRKRGEAATENVVDAGLDDLLRQAKTKVQVLEAQNANLEREIHDLRADRERARVTEERLWKRIEKMEQQLERGVSVS